MGDTRDPPGPASGGSATAPCLAPAARDAGWLMARELFQLAAPALGARPDELEAVGGRIQVEADPSKGMTFAEAASLIRDESVQVTADRDPNYDGYQRNCAGVQFVEVEVDTETGVVAVKRVVAVQDAGIVIAPTTYESQVIGGVIQGLSFALFEDRILDPTTGNLVNPDLLHYKIAGAMGHARDQGAVGGCGQRDELDLDDGSRRAADHPDAGGDRERGRQRLRARVCARCRSRRGRCSKLWGRCRRRTDEAIRIRRPRSGSSRPGEPWSRGRPSSPAVSTCSTA